MKTWEIEFDTWQENRGVYGYPVLSDPDEYEPDDWVDMVETEGEL